MQKAKRSVSRLTDHSTSELVETLFASSQSIPAPPGREVNWSLRCIRLIEDIPQQGSILGAYNTVGGRH